MRAQVRARICVGPPIDRSRGGRVVDAAGVVDTTDTHGAADGGRIGVYRPRISEPNLEEN